MQHTRNNFCQFECKGISEEKLHTIFYNNFTFISPKARQSQCYGTITGLDVADAPDKILEALNVVRTLKQAAHDDELPSGRPVELGDEIEKLLRQVLETMAAAEQPTEVA